MQRPARTHVYRRDANRVVDPELLTVPEIKEAITLAEEAAYTPAESAAYETFWDTVSTEKARFEDKYQAGKADGRAEEKTEIARRPLEEGMPIPAIARITGLNPADIEHLN